jgi:hypothetical protein
MSRVYLGRDNKIVLQLLVDGATVGSGTITRASFWIPETATVSGSAMTLDTETHSEIALSEGGSVVEISLGHLPLKPGSATCYLTAYDATNTNGIAWATITVSIKPWRP